VFDKGERGSYACRRTRQHAYRPCRWCICSAFGPLLVLETAQHGLWLHGAEHHSRGRAHRCPRRAWAAAVPAGVPPRRGMPPWRPRRDGRPPAMAAMAAACDRCRCCPMSARGSSPESVGGGAPAGAVDA
jgi:hypothetical protein